MEDPQERAKQLATTAADEYFQDCIAHLKWAGQCVVFEHDEELVVLLGDYTMESLA